MSILEQIWTILYFLMWVATLGVYQWRCRRIDGGTTIIASYCLYSFCALFIMDSLWFVLYPIRPITLFPYIYLYVMLMIALSPALYFHTSRAETIEDPQTRLIDCLAVIIIVSGLCLLPEIYSNFGNGIVKLLVDSEAGKDAYQEQLSNVQDSGSKVNNIAAVIFNAMSDIGVFLFFYYLSLKKKSIFMIVGLATSMVITILLPLMNGLRGSVIISVFTIVMSYFFMKRFLSSVVKTVARVLGTIFLSLVSLPIIAITFSRFGNGAIDLLLESLMWYIGQGSIYFNSYALDPGGSRYGDRVFNLFKRLIDPSTPANYEERRAKYPNLELDDNLFSTFVGDFCVDLGPVIAFALFVVFNFFVLYMIRHKGTTIKLHQMILLYFSMCVCMQGGMALFSFSDTGNLRIIVFALIYVYLYYHDQLLLKFPKNPA